MSMATQIYTSVGVQNGALPMDIIEERFRHLQNRNWPALRQWWLAHSAALKVTDNPYIVRWIAKDIFTIIRRRINNAA